MGNHCDRFRGKIYEVETSKRPERETVDRRAKTVYSIAPDELSTVSQDGPTVIRPHLITLYYPEDTPTYFTDKFPKKRVRKTADQSILIGRGVKADVLLNEQHMPRQFLELWCKVTPDGPKWYIKNICQRKLVRMNSDGARSSVKFQNEKELCNGCELKIDSLTFIVKIEDGDVSHMNDYELEVLCLGDDDMDYGLVDTANRRAWNRETTRSIGSKSAASTIRSNLQPSESIREYAQGSLPRQYLHHNIAPEAEHVGDVFHVGPDTFVPVSQTSHCCLQPTPGVQGCSAGCPAGHAIPPVRKQSRQEAQALCTMRKLSPDPFTAMPDARFFRQYHPGAAAVSPLVSRGPALPQDVFFPDQRGLQLHGEPYLPGQHVARHPPLYRDPPVAPQTPAPSAQQYALPELMEHNGHTSRYPLPPDHPWLVENNDHADFHPPLQQIHPAFSNPLRRSQSLFAPAMTRQAQERRRRSSYDNAAEPDQAAAVYVTQPESALGATSDLSMPQHGLSLPAISALVAQETAPKAVYNSLYRSDSPPAPPAPPAQPFLRMDSLKLVSMCSSSTAVKVKVSPDTVLTDSGAVSLNTADCDLRLFQGQNMSASESHQPVGGAGCSTPVLGDMNARVVGGSSVGAKTPFFSTEIKSPHSAGCDIDRHTASSPLQTPLSPPGCGQAVGSGSVHPVNNTFDVAFSSSNLPECGVRTAGVPSGHLPECNVRTAGGITGHLPECSVRTAGAPSGHLPKCGVRTAGVPSGHLPECSVRYAGVPSGNPPECSVRYAGVPSGNLPECSVRYAGVLSEAVPLQSVSSDMVGLSTDSAVDVQWSTGEGYTQGSRRLPQENDERQPQEHSDHS